jgi:hypothetical protein
MSDLVFETRRTRVRKWRESDLNAMLAVYGDRSNARAATHYCNHSA